MEVLPAIVKMSGIGCVRYLKAMIPQCIHCITPNELAPRCKDLELASLDALLAVMDACSARLFRWKGMIIEGVGKEWVTLCDKEGIDLKGLWPYVS